MARQFVGTDRKFDSTGMAVAWGGGVGLNRQQAKNCAVPVSPDSCPANAPNYGIHHAASIVNAQSYGLAAGRRRIQMQIAAATTRTLANAAITLPYDHC